MESPDVSEILYSVFLWIFSVPGIMTIVFGWTIRELFFKGSNEKNKGNEKLEKPFEMPAQDIQTVRKAEGVSVKASKKKQQSDKWSKHNFSHDWLLTSLKGHTGPILDMDFSANGKFLATCAEDRAIFVWNTKDWKEREHKFVRYNVDLDQASLLKWSPDTKAFVYKRQSDNSLDVCKVARRQDGFISSVTKTLSYQNLHKDDTIGIGVDINGRYVMSCSGGTEVVLIDLKGTELARFDTYLMTNYAAKISPCGKFIAVSGFAPDVKVWDVQFTRSGEFKQVGRAFELTGHSSGVYDFAFNADSTKMATVSKDGTWKLFNIKIEYEKGEEAHLLKSGPHKGSGERSHLALSPDGNVLALASASTLTLVNLIQGCVDKVISDIYPGSISKVLFDAGGNYVLTGGEKHVRVLRNKTGLRTNILEAKEKLREGNLSSATKERLEGIILSSQALLDSA